MAQPADLVPLADLKAYLNYPSSYTLDDGQLQPLIDAAAEFVDSWVDGDVLPRPRVERHDGRGQTEIQLGHYPILSIAYVNEYRSTGGVLALSESTPTNAVAGYQAEFSSGRLIRVYQNSIPMGWWPGSRNVEVSYTSGLVQVPALMRLAAMELVAHWWQQGHQAGLSVPGGSAGGSMGGYDAVDTGAGAHIGVPYKVLEKLERFTSPVLA